MKTLSLHRVRDLLNVLERTTGDRGDLTGSLEHIAQTAQEFFTADTCVIFAINPITDRFIASLTIEGNKLRRDTLADELPRREGSVQDILKQGVLLVEGWEAVPEYESIFPHAEAIRSFVGLALHIRHNQKPLGVLYLDFKQQQHFSDADRELSQLFAEQASFILQETWLLRRHQEVDRIGKEINQELDTIDILFQKLQTHAAGILDISHTLLLSVYQRQTNTSDFYMQEEGQLIHYEQRPPRGACQYTIETQQPVFIEHLSEQAPTLPFQIAHIEGTKPKESFIFVPLTLRDEPLGVLAIEHPEPYAYNQEDQSILELLANHIALALHNIRLYRSLYQLNETGGILTQQVDSEQTLQAAVNKIHEATRADLVVLYPYESTRKRFMLPPRIAGTLLDPASQESMSPNRPDGIATLILHRAKPIFAKQNTTIYTDLHPTRIQQGNFGKKEQLSSTAAIPLRVGEEVVGALFINFRQPQRFDATQKLFIEGLAHYAAIAIKNAQTFGSLSERRLEELVVLQHIDRELSRSLLDLESFLHTLLKHACERVPAEEASISLYSPHTQILEVQAAIGPNAEIRRRQSVSLHGTRSINRWVLEHKRPARVDNVHEDPRWRDLYVPIADGIVSELDVPLLDGDEVLGILNFESTKAGAFGHEDEDFLVTLAGQAVIAFKNAQAYEREKHLKEEAQELAAETQALNEISKEITSQLELNHVFDLILERALELTHSTLGSLHLYAPERSYLWMAAERGVAEEKKNIRQKLGEGIVGHAAASKKVLNVPDLSLPPWSDIYVEFIQGICSELVVPMFEGDKLRGVLNIESSLLNHFNASHERLLQGLADLAAVALQNAERYDQAKREAQRFALLYEAGQELSKIADLCQLEQAYDIILHLAKEQSQSLVVIRRYEGDVQEFQLTRVSQPQYFDLFQRTKLYDGINGQVARERRTIVIHDTSNLPPDVDTPQLLDPAIRTLLVTPTIFKEQYYGNLVLIHNEVGHFQNADVLFFEGLAQQLASTIYRLETVQQRQEFKQRAIAAEAMSSMGQAAFELTHRWDNDLGLVRSYVNDIQSRLKKLSVADLHISEKLDNIAQAVHIVLDLSERLKHELLKSGEAEAVEPAIIHPAILIEEALEIPLPANIHVSRKIDQDVADVQIIHSLVTDILNNLIVNAIQAMPEGGKITLLARNAGRSVALEVNDTGPGIPEQNLPKIFDLFYSTKGSTGFGLWSARRNALNNHGDLTIKSEVGKGTTFTLLLPKARGETL